MSDELLKVNGDVSCLQIEDRASLKLLNKGLVINNNGKNNIVKIGKGAILTWTFNHFFPSEQPLLLFILVPYDSWLNKSILDWSE